MTPNHSSAFEREFIGIEEALAAHIEGAMVAHGASTFIRAMLVFPLALWERLEWASRAA